MESFIPFIGIIALIGFFVRVMSNKERDEHWAEHEARLRQTEDMFNSISSADEECNRIYNEYMNSGNKTPDTQGLMFDTLSAIGCQPTNNDDGTLSVSYQGENFHMEFGGMYARVWDPMWAGVKADDPDMPKIREAVNAANFNFGPTVVLTSPNDEGVIGFHSRRDIMLHPSCPDNVPFVKAVLDSFFDAKEEVRNRYQQINAQQMEAKKSRRPVGFTTNLNTDKPEQE